MTREGAPVPSPAFALARPSAARGAELSAWDDYPVHQSAAPLATIAPALPGWAERFYFNLLKPSGEIVAIVGGGVYPARGIAECYFCRLDGDRQINVRGWSELPGRGAALTSGPFSLRCDSPLHDWSVEVDADDARFEGRFLGTHPAYLYSAVDVPASEPGGEFDLYRHFVAVGQWQLATFDGEGRDNLFTGVRDRTWGVRTRRIRLHNWYVFAFGDRCLTLIHQELADGSVFFSEAGVVSADGGVERLIVEQHHLLYDPQTREVIEGAFDLAGERGSLRLEYERVGRAMRLAGAGYDERQGARDTSTGTQRDEYDLGDPEVARKTGRGTMDAGARARVTGAWSAEGTGVVETAVARDHAKYGRQIR
ncbi:MAG: hypothetical protein ACRDLD_01795 [Thermoleophilaceae bacterium]